MALNEDTTTWIAFSPTANDFSRYGVSNADYLTLLSQASIRAKNYILNDLNIPQGTLDAVVDGDKFQLAYQKLTAYELIQVRVGFYANTLPFNNYSSPEEESVNQSEQDLNKWLDVANRLRSEALSVLEEYVPKQYKRETQSAMIYNWSY